MGEDGNGSSILGSRTRILLFVGRLQEVHRRHVWDGASRANKSSILTFALHPIARPGLKGAAGPRTVLFGPCKLSLATASQLSLSVGAQSPQRRVSKPSPELQSSPRL